MSKAKIKIVLGIGMLLTAVTFSNCTFKENKLAGSGSFSSEVSTIFSDKCFKCHAGGNSQGGFGFIDDAEKLVSNGFISPGDPEESLIYKKITGTQEAGERMPKGGPYLSESEIASVYDWILNFGVTPSIAITSPENNSYIDSTTNSATYTVSGTCNIKGATVTIKVNGVAGGTTTCSDGIFSATVDTTGSLFSNGSNTVVANLNKSAVGADVDSSAITLIKDLNALAIALTTPGNTATYRTVAGTGGSKVVTGSDSSFITSSNTSTTFAFSGTCNSTGGVVTLKIDGTSVASVTCDGSAFSGTFDSTALSDGTHKLVASYAGTSTTSTVYIYKWVAAPTISFETDIRPLLANLYSDPSDAGGLPANTSACIDCHYVKTSNAVGSSSFTMGYWAECPSGGRWDGAACTNTPATNNGNRDNFVFRFSYAKNTVASTCTTGCTPSGTEYTYSFPIVNDNPDSANTVRNKIVRGNPDQSFVYKKTSAASALCADGAKAKTDVTSASNNRMPSNGGTKDYFSAADLAKIQTWITEGARTDN